MDDLSNKGSLAGSLNNFIAAYFRDNIDGQLPAIVTSYDSSSNRASVQPLVARTVQNNAKLSREIIPNIPVFRYGGGGFFIALPVKAGDFGWLRASDADTSLVMQKGGGEDVANTTRQNSFSDAVFFPDMLKGWDLADEDGLCLQSLDNSTQIVLKDGEIIVKSDEMNAEIPSIKVKGNYQIEGNVVITGSLTTSGGDVDMSGNVKFTGRLDTIGEITNNGKDIGSEHTHSGVQSGDDDTGAPV